MYLIHSQPNPVEPESSVEETINRIHDSFKEHLTSALQSLENNLKQQQQNEVNHKATNESGSSNGQLTHENVEFNNKSIELEQQLNKTNAANVTLKKQLTKMEKTMDEKNVEINRFEESIKNLIKQLSNESTDKQQLKATETGQANEHLSEIQNQMIDVKAENDIIKHQLAAMDIKLIEKNIEIDGLQQRLHDAHNQLSTMDTHLNQTNAENAELKENYSKVNKQFLNWRRKEPEIDESVLNRIDRIEGIEGNHGESDRMVETENQLVESITNVTGNATESNSMDNIQPSEQAAILEPPTAIDAHLNASSTPTAPPALNQPTSVKFECFICKKTFRHLFVLNMHMKTNHICEDKENAAQPKFVCPKPKCGKSFVKQWSLSVHTRRSHSGGRSLFVCKQDNCGKTLANADSFKRHKRTHDGQRPYVCNERKCGRSFGTKSNLDLHYLRIHTTDRPYICEQPKCKKSYAALCDLNYHKQTHTGQRPYVCKEPNCDKSFYAPTHLKDHMRSHTGAQPFACKVPKCGMKFTRKSSLTSHMSLHNREKTTNRTRVI